MPILNIPLKCEEETHSIARDLALVVNLGDLITLEGELGAGKTSFAREFIRHFLQLPELEIPSPTYLIALEYKNTSNAQAMHMDLYRISHPDELEELGLEEALAHGIAIIEWPQIAGDQLPTPALNIEFKITGEATRELQITGDEKIISACARTLKIRAFLHTNWNANIVRIPFAADASARNYELVTSQNEQRLLMDAPRTPDGPPLKNGLPYSRIAHLAEEVLPFVAVSIQLRSNGFRSPQIYAYDLDSGLVLLEHLGEGKITDENNNPIAERYLKSAELLSEIHTSSWANTQTKAAKISYDLPVFNEPAMAVEVDLLTEWYLPDCAQEAINENDVAEFRAIWKDYCKDAQSFKKSIVLRDFHSPNIIWRDEMSLKDNIGLIDFQDALVGPAVYDLVSLTQDARVIVTPELENQIVDHYVDMRQKNDPNFDTVQFRYEYALMGAQRASKILGIFVRLDNRDGKPQYRKLLPQIQNYLKRNLQHPKLDRYKAWCERVIRL